MWNGVITFLFFVGWQLCHCRIFQLFWFRETGISGFLFLLYSFLRGLVLQFFVTISFFFFCSIKSYLLLVKHVSFLPLQLHSPGVLAIGSSMKGENSYSLHLDSNLSTGIFILQPICDGIFVCLWMWQSYYSNHSVRLNSTRVFDMLLIKLFLWYRLVSLLWIVSHFIPLLSLKGWVYMIMLHWTVMPQ